MADDDVSVTYSADASSLVGATSDVEARLSALESAFNASAAAATTSASSLERHEEASGSLSEAVKQLADHSLTAARGFEVLGLEADAGAAKLAGLAEVLEGLEHSFAPLLAVGAVIGALSASFDLLKDGVNSAAKFESQMVTLGQAVKNQGGNWSEISEQIREYLEVQEQATGYDANEVLGSLNKLITAGASYKDAMYLNSVAEDVAAAKHITLEEATNALISAEAGRAQGLERLDPKLRDLIKSHSDLYTVMQQLERDMGGEAAAAADTYEGVMRRLQAAEEGVVREIGEKMLPTLEGLANAMIGVVDEIDKATKSWEGFATAGAKALSFVSALARGDFATVGAMVGGAAATGIGIQATAQGKRNAALRNQGGLDNDPTLGNDGGQGDGYQPPVPTQRRDTAKYDDPTAIDAVTAAIDKYKASETQLEIAVALASTAAQKQTAETALQAAKQSDAAAEITLVKNAITEDTAARNAQVAATRASFAALEQADSALKAYQQSLKGTKDETQEQKDQMAALELAVKKASQAYDDERSKLDTANSTLKKHADQLKTLQSEYDKLREKTLQTVSDISVKWDEFYTKSQKDMAEDLATSQMTNAQKTKYYLQLFDTIDTTTKEGEAQAEDVWKKYDDAVKGVIKDLADAHKKWVDEMTKEIDTYLDDVVTKHESMASILKSIYQDIEKNFLAMVSKMVASPLASLFYPGGAGAGGTGVGGLSSGAGSASILPAAFGLTGMMSGVGASGGGFAPNGSSQSPFYVIAHDSSSNFNYNMTGSTSGVPGLVGGTGGSGGALGAGSALSSIGSLLGIGVGGGALGNGIDSVLTGGAKGDSANAAIGGVAGAAGAFGLTSLLSAGGLLGGGGSIGLAALLSNPIGWGILGGGAILGGVLGGLFGPHETAAEEPDISEPVVDGTSYGQFTANLTGHPLIAGGNTYTPGSQYYTGIGGEAEGSQVLQQIESVLAEGSSAPPAIEALAQQLDQLTNGETTGNPFNIVNEKQGIYTLQSGAQVSVQQLMQEIGNFESDLGGSTEGSPIYSIGRSYPDFNLGTLQNTGTSTPVTGGTTTTTGGVTVIVQNPSIVGASGLSDVAVAIGQAIQRAAQGTIIGSPSNWAGTRRYLQGVTSASG